MLTVFLQRSLRKVASNSGNDSCDFTATSENGEVPRDFKDALIIHIYKRKGDRASCDYHRGISLLSVAGKIPGHIIVNRLSSHVFHQDVIPESQCGFLCGRGTADMIFTARQIQEKCREQQVDLYMIFINLTKAFDTVHRNGFMEGSDANCLH